MTTENEFPEWPPGISSDHARGLTPDQCKAILVARAALEARNNTEIHAQFRIERQGGDWWVTADYTVPRGYVSPPGNFSTVVIAPDWSVKRVIGGA